MTPWLLVPPARQLAHWETTGFLAISVRQQEDMLKLPQETGTTRQQPGSLKKMPDTARCQIRSKAARRLDTNQAIIDIPMDCHVLVCLLLGTGQFPAAYKAVFLLHCCQLSDISVKQWNNNLPLAVCHLWLFWPPTVLFSIKGAMLMMMYINVHSDDDINSM